MKWTVDKIIDNIVVLENMETLEKVEIDVKLLPFSIHEGAILVDMNGEYIMDKTEEEKRRQLIEEKFRRLRNNN